MNFSQVFFDVFSEKLCLPRGPQVRHLSEPGAEPMIMPSAGVHVTLPDYYSPEHLGMIVPKTKDGRVVFMLPWQDATIAGTTGTAALALLTLGRGLGLGYKFEDGLHAALAGRHHRWHHW